MRGGQAQIEIAYGRHQRGKIAPDAFHQRTGIGRPQRADGR
jgi:hypothetical protein